MRTVMVTKFVPLPADSGGKRRSLALLERLAARGPTVLCAFDDGSADIAGLTDIGVDVRAVHWPPSTSSTLQGVLRTGSASAARFWSTALRREVEAATGQATDLLQIEYAQLAPYASRARADLRVLDFHNVESSLVESYARIQDPARRALMRIEAGRLRRIERTALKTFDAAVVVSESDRARLPAPANRIVLCPNGWEPEPPLPFTGQPVVAFVALMSWGPNADAAVWLAREVWPLVREALAEAKLLLVGRDPGPEVMALADSSIEVVGRVPDVRPHLARASVAVAPLRAGGGSRLKVLEALGAGRPVVATTIGAEGLDDLIGHGVVIADQPSRLAESLIELLRHPAEARTLGQKGHAAVTERYSWDATLSPFFELVDTHRTPETRP
jgi:polysaccharide biosynthesis protein PslH